jgi:hypothetical protein
MHETAYAKIQPIHEALIITRESKWGLFFAANPVFIEGQHSIECIDSSVGPSLHL